MPGASDQNRRVHLPGAPTTRIFVTFGFVLFAQACPIGNAYGQTPPNMPAPIPSLVSDYLQELLNYAEYAAGAVQCGLRPKEWDDTLHNMFVSLVETHAGSPVPDIAPDGTMTYTAHIPSDAEKLVALAALARREREGVYQASQQTAQQGDATSYCAAIKNMSLSQLDDFETNTTSMWPSD